MSRFRLHMSYNASLSYMIVTSVCSKSECPHKAAQAGARPTSDGVVDHKALETRAIVRKLP